MAIILANIEPQTWNFESILYYEEFDSGGLYLVACNSR
jgi:hypothetical protein